MTRLKKLFATMLLVLVTVCSVLGSAVLNIARSIFTSSSAKADVVSIPGNQNDTDEVQAGSVVSIPGFLTKVEKNNSITLPMSSVKVNGVNLGDGLVNLFVEVTDIYGQALTQYDDAEGTQVVANMGEQVAITGAATAKELVLTPSKAGIYNVKYYVLSNGVWTSTNTYNIRVAEESYKMVFEGNGATVMPSTFKHNIEGGQDINIALPLLYDENGELIENQDILLGAKQGTGANAYYYVLRYEDVAGAEGVTLSDVSKINETNNVYSEYKTYTVKKVVSDTISADIKYALHVDLKNSGSFKMSNHDTSAEGTQLLTLSGVGETATAYDKTPFTFHVDSSLGGGDYVLTYNLHKVNLGNVAPTSSAHLNYTMTADSSFDQANVKVYAKPASKVKRSDVSYGEKHYLPSVNAANASDANTTVEAFYYYSIGVESGDDLVYAADKVVLGHDENGFYFIPKTSGATYEFDYKAVDAFGNTSDTTSTDNYYTIQIYDEHNPIAVYTKAFDPETVDQTNPETIADFEDISYVIPTKYAISSDTETKTIRIPALAASDYSGLREVTRFLSSTSFIVDANGTLASSTKTLNITKNTGKLTESDSINQIDLREYLKFEDSLGRLIDAYGYLIDENGDYVDGQGNPVAEANKVFAFKDGEGHDLTSGDALRDAFNACEAIITLRKDVFAAGTYTLTMRAIDIGTKINTNKDNTITLVDYDDLEETTPTVKYNESKVSSVVDNQDVYIAIPTVKDDADKNLLVKYYVDVEGAAELIEVNTDEDGKYITFNTSLKDSADHSIFELAAASASKSFKVVTFAFNDYALTASELISETGTNLLAEALQQYDATDDTFAHIGYASYKVNVKNYASDAIPTITTLPTVLTMDAPTQYEEYEVGGFVFKDDTDTARVQVSITDTKGNSYDYSFNGAITIVEENSEYIYTVPGIKFLPNNADDGNEYTVTYRVVDDAKNTVSYSFVLIHAVNREIPAISGISGEEATLELGETYVFSDVDFGNAQKVEVTAWKGTEQVFISNADPITFAPTSTGEYTIRFTAINGTDPDNDPTQTREFKINVVDTLAPIINYVEPIQGGETILITEDEIVTENNVVTYPNVKLPTISAQDQWSKNAIEDLVDTTDISIKITTPSATYTLDRFYTLPADVANTLNITRNNDFLYFTPTARGTYTITYSAQDAAGNQATSKVITVKVGDTEKPTIELTNAFKNKLENGFVIGKNDTLTINNNAIVLDGSEFDQTNYNIMVSDNDGFNSTYDATYDDYIQRVTVSITDSNGATISPEESTDNLLHYTFTTSGTYTLKITVYDKNGNQSTPFTKQFYVTTQESTQSDASTIVGIALIVASALVLAGVIVYFVRGTKMLPKKKANKQSKKED